MRGYIQNGPRILPERALHEYRQRIRLVWGKRRDLLEARAPVQLERADADVAGLQPRQRQPFGARPVEQPHEHGEGDTAAARPGLEVHALELGPLAAVLRG